MSAEERKLAVTAMWFAAALLVGGVVLLEVAIRTRGAWDEPLRMVLATVGGGLCSTSFAALVGFTREYLRGRQ